jgi:GTP-binding protein
MADSTTTTAPRRDDLRNVAIIAHVDHGKTTLVDALLRQSGNFRDTQLSDDLIMDSNPLEKERGITILSKNVAITYRAEDGTETKINLIDTPGHADFGGEVERVLSMADGCFLLVDAAEGPMPQTRFVLSKALALGLKPIVVINKIDRPDKRPDEVLNEIFDLFVELDAHDDQLDFPVLYASGRDGWASDEVDKKGEDIRPIFEAILQQVPGPEADIEGALKMRIQTLAYSEYVGRIAVGRVWGGRVKTNMQIKTVGREGEKAGRIQQVQVFEGFGRKDVAEASAGDIVALVGLPDVEIGNSVVDPQNPSPMPALEIEPPTLTMTFRVNDSPFVGKDGDHVTSRKIRDRLHKELESNFALKVEDTDDNDAMRVSGRGLMHLGILIETMRREGYELSVGKPEVVLKRGEDGTLLEPVEHLVVDVPESNMGPVMEMVGNRRGTLEKMDQRGGITHLEFSIPARGLIGLRTRLLTATAGEAIVHHNFAGYQPAAKNDPGGRSAGVMIANLPGKATAYKINELQQRGILFVGPTDEVYEGMVVGEHARENDIVVNITEAKQLTNFRTTSKDQAEYLKPAWKPTVEQALEYVGDDEYVEVTPTGVRLRKQMLKENDRKRHERGKAKREKEAAMAVA